MAAGSSSAAAAPSLSHASPYIALAGTAASAFGSVEQGNQQSTVDQYNAAVASTNATMQSDVDTYNAQVEEQQAEIAEQTASAQADIQNTLNKRVIGTSIANYGASGIEGATPLQTLMDQSQQGELAKQLILYRGATTALSDRQRGTLDTLLAQQALASGGAKAGLADLEAGQASSAGLTKGGTTLLTGAASQLKSLFPGSSGGAAGGATANFADAAGDGVPPT